MGKRITKTMQKLLDRAAAEGRAEQLLAGTREILAGHALVAAGLAAECKYTPGTIGGSYYNHFRRCWATYRTAAPGGAVLKF